MAVYITNGISYVWINSRSPEHTGLKSRVIEGHDFRTVAAAMEFAEKYPKLCKKDFYVLDTSSGDKIQIHEKQAGEEKPAETPAANGTEETDENTSHEPEAEPVKTVSAPEPAKPAKKKPEQKAVNQPAVHEPGNDAEKHKPDVGLVSAKVTRKVLSNKERLEVYEKDGGRCYICGRKLMKHEFTVEHKVPLAKGGTYDMSNLFCACEMCNTMKNGYDIDDFVLQAERIARFQKTERHKAQIKACGRSIASVGKTVAGEIRRGKA